MNNLNGTVITALGEKAIIDTQLGKKLTFTRMAIGDGVQEDMHSATALFSEKMSRPLTSVTGIYNNRQYEALAIFSNKDLKTGFYINEVGLFGKIEDGEEFLYCYACVDKDKNGGFIDTDEDGIIISQEITLLTSISQNANVTIVVDPNNYMKGLSIAKDNKNLGLVTKLNFIDGEVEVKDQAGNVDIGKSLVNTIKNNKEVANIINDKIEVNEHIVNIIEGSIQNSQNITSIIDNKLKDSQIKKDLDTHKNDNKIHIGTGNVGTEAVADKSITSPKIADGAITSDKIAAGAITAANLSEEVKNNISSGGSVDASKIPDNAIVTGKIKDGSITEVKLADNSVTTNKIKDGSITSAKLSEEVKNTISSGGSGGASAILNNSITADKIKDVQELSNHVVIGNGAKYTIYKDSNGKEQNYSTVVIGKGAQTSTFYGTAIGRLAEATGTWSTAVGDVAKATSSYSTAIGDSAQAKGQYSTALGYYAKATSSYSTALGRYAETTTTYQIMLGHSDATPYAYHSLVVTSDKRDKANIKDINFNSLDFINKLKPKQYKMDCRSNYTRDEEISKEEYEQLDEYTKKSHTTKYTVYEIENGIKYINYCNRDYIYKHENKNITKDTDRYKPIFKTKDLFLSKESAEKELRKKLSKEGVENPANTEHFEEKKVGEIILKEVFLESDGSRAGERYHNGFLAQEVEEVAKSMNFDFAGVKYLAYNGDGEDMYGLSYEEFIAPIVGGIQELSKENSDVNAKLNILTTKNNELENKNNELTTKLNDVTTKLNDVTTKLNDVTTKLNDLIEKFNNLKN